MLIIYYRPNTSVASQSIVFSMSVANTLLVRAKRGQNFWRKKTPELTGVIFTSD